MLWISDVKGPKKMFPDLPFGNADSDKVEARKSQLDTFLKVGISCITSVMKLFLWFCNLIIIFFFFFFSN